MKKINQILILIIAISFQNNLFADTPYYLNFKFILNQSEAGKKAQKTLKTKLDSGFKKFQEREKKIQEEEKQIIQQKIISSEEYKKKVDELRNKVSNLQKERNKLLSDVAKQRTNARNQLLKSKSIIKNYMF